MLLSETLRHVSEALRRLSEPQIHPTETLRHVSEPLRRLSES